MQDWLQRDYVKPYVRLLCRVILTVLCLFVLTRAVPVIFAFFLPFILAFVVATAMNPLICLLQRKWKAPRAALSVLMVVLALVIVLAVIGGFVYALGREIVAVAQNIDGVMEYFGQTIQTVSVHLSWLTGYIPADTEEMLSGLMDGFTLWVQAQGTAFADTVITQTVNVTARVGGGIISVIIFIMASYFMMADYPRLSQKLQNFFTPKAYKGYSMLKDATLLALGRFLRAQLLIAFFIFLFSLAGLLIFRQEYALLLAFVFSVIDFLPLIGTSIVLVPWAIVNIVAGSVGRGIYLLAMSLALFLLRRVIEPKVVGSQMGLSPLAAIVSIYIGMQLGGVLGLILGPVVAMVFVSLYKVGLFDGWIKDINAVLNLRKKSEVSGDSEEIAQKGKSIS